MDRTSISMSNAPFSNWLDHDIGGCFIASDMTGITSHLVDSNAMMSRWKIVWSNQRILWLNSIKPAGFWTFTFWSAPPAGVWKTCRLQTVFGVGHSAHPRPTRVLPTNKGWQNDTKMPSPSFFWSCRKKTTENRQQNKTAFSDVSQPRFLER